MDSTDNRVTITPEDFLALFTEDYDEPPEGVKLVQAGEWEAAGKYQHRTDVFLHEESTRYFAVHHARSGSYHTDYDYAEPSCDEVAPREVMQVVYEVVR